MLTNYIKTAFRSFTRNKSSFLINVLGLSIGLTCSFLIVLWVFDELKMDQYHSDIDQIHLIMGHHMYRDEIITRRNTPGILARNLVNDFPEFEYASNYTWPVGYLFTRGDQTHRERGRYVENSFFNILDIDLIYGNKDELLSSPNTIVLSESMTKNYFENSNPVGEGITMSNGQELMVTGVFTDMPIYSGFQFSYLLPYEDWLGATAWANTWESFGPRTITKLNVGVDTEDLNKKIKDYIATKNEATFTELFVYPFGDLYLKGNFKNKEEAGGRIEYVRLFSVIALFILLIACINFMNLSTAKASKRSKEVGIRKSIGASKGSLVGQFIGESMLISFFALFISIVLVEVALPAFNNLTDKSISVDYTNPVLVSSFFGMVLLTGFIAGSYPAFFLSSLQAIQTLKGSIKSSWKEALARKGLVVFQVSLSIILIVSTIAIYNQIQFTQNKNLGYTKENLIYFNTEANIREQWDTVKDQMEKIPGVLSIARTTHTFLGPSSGVSGLVWPGSDPDEIIQFEQFGVDYGLIETMGIELVDGRSFSDEFGSDSSSIMLNETAIRVMGLENPVGETVTVGGEDYTVIGITKDVHFQSFRTEVSPSFFRLRNAPYRAFARIESNDISNTLSRIEEVYKQFNQEYPFEYSFMDQRYANLYRAEMRVGTLSRYFAFIAIFISCLGLFGLSAFTAEQRAKEIGVRKVLGASIRSLIMLLSTEYTRLVLMAIVVSIPISWYIMQAWMSGFAYSTGVDWWIFIVAGCSALLITWLTVSFQSVKAAIVNPVKSLKPE
ncbi:MAG: ABC transporter permease [Bacteroidota bacterium]